MLSEDHEIPMAEPWLPWTASLSAAASDVLGGLQPWYQESHFQQFSAFFVFACALFHSKTWLFLPPWKETLSSVWGCSGSVLGRTCPGKGDVWGSLGRMAYGAGMLSSGSSACLEILHRKVSFHNALGHFQTALAVWVGMQAWCPRSLEAQQQWGLAHWLTGTSWII